MNTHTTKYPFPATAPTSAQTITLVNVTGKQASDMRRLLVTVLSSHDSGASGVVFSALLDNGSTYRTFTSYTYLATDGVTTYRIACPAGAVGIKAAFTNSANVLTTWEGCIGAFDDEIAAA